MNIFFPLLCIVLVQSADTVVLSQQICADCRIRAEHVVTLGDADGPGVLGENVSVARDARGRYWVTDWQAQGVISVFSATGHFRRTVGREGSGPGEFKLIGDMTASSAGVEVFDWLGHRWTTVGLDFKFRATRAIAAEPTSAVVFASGDAVVAAIIRSAERVGYTLHQVDSSGRLVRSFGAPGLPFRNDALTVFRRALTPSAEPDNYWVAHSSEYAFEKCVRGRTACRVFLRPTSWFRPHAQDVTPSRTDPPKPYLKGVSPYRSKLVWTLVLVPDKEWREGVVQPPGTGNSIDAAYIGDSNKYFDTVIELVDVARANVVARARLDMALHGFIGPSTAYSYRVDAGGVPRVDIVQLHLDGNPFSGGQ